MQEGCDGGLKFAIRHGRRNNVDDKRYSSASGTRSRAVTMQNCANKKRSKAYRMQAVLTADAQ